MKRSYEDRVRFAGKGGYKTNHKPNRNSYGFHKTRRHFQETIEEKFIEEEIDEELSALVEMLED